MTTRILIIEDNHTNIELMVYLLDAFGYNLIAETDGEKGLETALRDRPDREPVVLLLGEAPDREHEPGPGRNKLGAIRVRTVGREEELSPDLRHRLRGYPSPRPAPVAAPARYFAPQ